MSQSIEQIIKVYVKFQTERSHDQSRSTLVILLSVLFLPSGVHEDIYVKFESQKLQERGQTMSTRRKLLNIFCLFCHTCQVSMLISCACFTCLMLTFQVTELQGKETFFVWVCLLFGSFSGNYSLLPTATAKCFGREFMSMNFGLLFTSRVRLGISAYIIPVTARGIQQSEIFSG